MRREDFTPEAPGRLELAWGTPPLGGYLTYVPNPLPPTLTFTNQQIRAISDATMELGRLSGVGQQLPNPLLLMRTFIRREAVLSSKIEGTITRLDQLFLYEAQPDELTSIQTEDAAEVAAYVRAAEYGLERLNENRPISLNLIREVHARLMAGVRGQEKRPGEFRVCGVLIAREGQRNPDSARFVPPCHRFLNEVLDPFENYINVDRDLPDIVQLALAHYQFETIHPFMDGNGRLGRLLITLMLSERRILLQPLLYLSAYLERHNVEYRDHLLAVSQRGSWLDWIEFFVRGIAEQAQDAARRSEQLLTLQKTYHQKIGQESSSVTTLRLVDELFASPIITTNLAVSRLGVTFPTAQKSIGKLVDAGLLREITGHQRNRVYQADAILRLLDAPIAGTPDTLTP